jgi:hypothetical protein
MSRLDRKVNRVVKPNKLSAALMMVDGRCVLLRPKAKQLESRLKTVAYAQQASRYISEEEFASLRANILQELETGYKNRQVCLYFHCITFYSSIQHRVSVVVIGSSTNVSCFLLVLCAFLRSVVRFVLCILVTPFLMSICSRYTLICMWTICPKMTLGSI